MSHHGKKEMSFELDLLPFISVLSCCICFLLLTAVWTNLGTLNISQGLGQESTRSEEQQKNSSLWITMRANGDVEFSVKDSKTPGSRANEMKVQGNGRVNWAQVQQNVRQLNAEMPGLKTALIMPQQNVAYGDVITLMDNLKSHKISEVGIAPL